MSSTFLETKQILAMDSNTFVDLNQVMYKAFGLNEALYKQSQYLLKVHQNDADLLLNSPVWAHPDAQTFSSSSQFSQNVAHLANSNSLSDVVAFTTKDVFYSSPICSIPIVNSTIPLDLPGNVVEDAISIPQVVNDIVESINMCAFQYPTMPSDFNECFIDFSKSLNINEILDFPILCTAPNPLMLDGWYAWLNDICLEAPALCAA